MISKNRGLAGLLGGKRKGRMPDLGSREIDALDRLWSTGQLSAQALLEQMGQTQLTLNTVQSTLERLHRKGLVLREKRGRAYQYTAALSRAQLISRLLRDLADEVGGGELAPMISGFVEFVAGDDPAIESEVETELARLLERKEDRGD